MSCHVGFSESGYFCYDVLKNATATHNYSLIPLTVFVCGGKTFAKNDSTRGNGIEHNLSRPQSNQESIQFCHELSFMKIYDIQIRCDDGLNGLLSEHTH